MQQYRRVSELQRCQIEALIGIASVKEIAFRLKVHASTVYRELKRNSLRSCYQASTAEGLAKKRREHAVRVRVFEDPEKLAQLKQKLANEWSPELIAGRLKICSHQTIYNEIKRHRPELKVHLGRFGRKSGRPRNNRRVKREK